MAAPLARVETSHSIASTVSFHSLSPVTPETTHFALGLSPRPSHTYLNPTTNSGLLLSPPLDEREYRSLTPRPRKLSALGIQDRQEKTGSCISDITDVTWWSAADDAELRVDTTVTSAPIDSEVADSGISVTSESECPPAVERRKSSSTTFSASTARPKPTRRTSSKKSQASREVTREIPWEFRMCPARYNSGEPRVLERPSSLALGGALKRSNTNSGKTVTLEKIRRPSTSTGAEMGREKVERFLAGEHMHPILTIDATQQQRSLFGDYSFAGTPTSTLHAPASASYLHPQQTLSTRASSPNLSAHSTLRGPSCDAPRPHKRAGSLSAPCKKKEKEEKGVWRWMKRKMFCSSPVEEEEEEDDGSVRRYRVCERRPCAWGSLREDKKEREGEKKERWDLVARRGCKRPSMLDLGGLSLRGKKEC